MPHDRSHDYGRGFFALGSPESFVGSELRLENGCAAFPAGGSGGTTKRQAGPHRARHPAG